MQTFVKLLITISIILICTHFGKKLPSLAGLIAVMPLTGLIVLVWLYSENPGNHELMTNYTKGAFWGLLPSILFFLVVYVCFKNNLTLPFALLAGFSAWLTGAFLHQLYLK